MLSIRPNGANMDVKFSSVSGKTYQLEFASVLGGSWIVVHDDLAGTGNPVVGTHTNGASQPGEYYRVKLKTRP
jgi:hypothetical protein